MIQPSGTCSPLLTATISLPSATIDVVTSRTTGSPPATGTPIEIGIRREPPVAAAERRDAQRARRVEEVQRHLARIRRHVRPIADAAQVSAVGEADHRDARLRRLGDADALRRTRRSPGRSRDGRR